MAEQATLGLARKRRDSGASPHAFTLIELLVVVGIIAVLASLLMPVIAIVRSQANRAKCASNLRMIGAALTAYAADHDGWTPPICTPGVNAPGYACHGPWTWDPIVFVKPLVPYGLDVTHVICPASGVLWSGAAAGTVVISTAPPTADYGTGEWEVNYCYFAGLSDPKINIHLGVGAATFYDTINRMPTLRPFRGPANMILLGEVNVWWNITTPQFTTNHGGGMNSGQLADLFKAVTGSNRYYVDGHVEWVSLGKMGKNDTMPNDTDPTTSHYSHYSNLRPYYW